MVRISDARMSGTAYGTVVLHVAPEAAAGGPLALVRDGDMIELDVAGRRLELAGLGRGTGDPPRATGSRRRRHEGGYQSLYVERVLQADAGLRFRLPRRPARCRHPPAFPLEGAR